MAVKNQMTDVLQNFLSSINDRTSDQEILIKCLEFSNLFISLQLFVHKVTTLVFYFPSLLEIDWLALQ